MGPVVDPSMAYDPIAEITKIVKGNAKLDSQIEQIFDMYDKGGAAMVYQVMSEDDVKRNIAKPWVSFCSDSASLAPAGVFLKSNPHPRAYGSFARLLGKYVREERSLTLEEAVRKASALPAEILHLTLRRA